MKLIFGDDEPHYGGSVVAFGNFDGFHLGHASIVSTVVRLAHDSGRRAVIVTFNPHTAEFIGGRTSFVLTKLERKVELLRNSGIDILRVLNFNDKMMKVSAECFISDILLKVAGAENIVVGEGCSFGYKKSGNLELLRKFSKNYAYTLTELPAHCVDGVRCSSSKVRESLVEGNLACANKMLGYCHQIEGQIVSGDKRGREIGYPTINIVLDGIAVPRYGVYKTLAELGDGKWRSSISNIGVRPTFSERDVPLLETNILDGTVIQNDLQRVKVQLIEFIREERKFDDIDSLKNQIVADVQYVKNSIFGGNVVE